MELINPNSLEAQGFKDGRRGKPSVAYINQENAKLNIKVKAKLLTNLVGSFGATLRSAPGPSFEKRMFDLNSYPKSIRQFNGWNSSQLEIEIQKLAPVFYRNANSTLRNDALLLDCVQTALKAIAKFIEKGGRRPSKDETQGRLRDRISLSNAQVEILEKELVTAWRNNSLLREEVDTISRQYAALKREVSDILNAQKVTQPPSLRKRTKSSKSTVISLIRTQNE